MDTRNMTTRDLCLISACTAATIILTQVSIPMPYGVPMTLQTFIIPFTGIVLGSKRATLGAVIYVLLGAIGIPVFAGLTGGLGAVFGPTGGFILTFPFLAFTAGMASDKGKGLSLYGWLTLGAAVNFLCGMLVFSLVTGSTFGASFFACVLPFLPTAVIKIILSGVLGLKCKHVLRRSEFLA